MISKDFTAESDDMFESIREPLPMGVERFPGSLSEELYKAATWNTDIDTSHFGNHRDTFAIFELRHLQDRRLALPSAFFDILISYIDFETYLAIRLSCRCWSAAITKTRPISWPAVSMLPAEILENVLRRLDPIDFNAARHTCRAWMIASLEERLLSIMLKRGGWWAASMADRKFLEDNGERDATDSINRAWLLSKRLATECSFLPDWTSNDVIGSPLPSSVTGLAMTSETDFTELSNGYRACENGQSGVVLQLTASVCGKFLLVAEGCIIYVYSLRNKENPSQEASGHLSPFTTVICPHRVLAVSMDTSSGRFAVAALLQGRIGMVCDLHEGTRLSRRQSRARTAQDTTRDFRSTLYSPASLGEHIWIDDDPPRADGTAHSELTNFHGSCPNDRALDRATAEGTHPEIHGARVSPASWTMADMLAAKSAASSGTPQSGSIPGLLPIENGPRSVYRNLCSAEDPPRSVAICPQRRCVAFGCSAGIELHWVDALTGQDLNRWFPLTAHSDFLYFLPPRMGVDSAKKLRLISSACHPKEKDGLQSRFFPGNAEARHHGMTWDEGIYDPAAWDVAWRGSGWSDHYRAIPVSDGWNILFTDPEEGMLSLGSDALPGAGATRLVRRFVFLGPSDEAGSSIVPRVYASGGDLKWGVRIAAAYGEEVWVYVVPPDLFQASDRRASSEAHGEHDVEGVDAIPPPLKVSGVKIGNVPGLVDVTVDSSAGDLTIWAFSVHGIAYVWQLQDHQHPILKRVVLQDGTICAAKDDEGDYYMHNTSKRTVQFDGSDSAPAAPSTPFLTQDRVIDRDGDMSMPDVVLQDEGYVSGDEEFAHAGGPFAIHAPPIRGDWDQDDDWVPDYLARSGQEIEDEGLGIDLLELTRLDVEILCG